MSKNDFAQFLTKGKKLQTIVMQNKQEGEGKPLVESRKRKPTSRFAQSLTAYKSNTGD